MTVFNAVVLGIVQGLTEFLPISSSGHLVIMQNFFNSGVDYEKQYLLFFTMLHFGTLVSVFLVYWKDVLSLIDGFWGIISDTIKTGNPQIHMYPQRRMFVLILISTIPLVLVGLPLNRLMNEMLSSLTLVSFTLLFTGALLWVADRIESGDKDQKNTKFSNAFVVGLFQAAAILPGLSRSGSTIVGGLFNKFNKDFAVKFSFLMSIPAVLGATVLEIPEAISVLKDGTDKSLMPVYLLGTVVAGIIGFLSIKFLLNVLKRGKLFYFAYYCWLMSIVIIVYNLFFKYI